MRIYIYHQKRVVVMTATITPPIAFRKGRNDGWVCRAWAQVLDAKLVRVNYYSWDEHYYACDLAQDDIRCEDNVVKLGVVLFPPVLVIDKNDPQADRYFEEKPNQCYLDKHCTDRSWDADIVLKRIQYDTYDYGIDENHYWRQYKISDIDCFCRFAEVLSTINWTLNDRC